MTPGDCDPVPPHTDLLRAYIGHLGARRCTARTIQTYTEELYRAHRAMPHGVPLASDREIETWLGSNPRWSARTIQLRLTVLQGFFRWAVRTGHLSLDPTDTLTAPRPPRRRRPPATTEQVRTILARTQSLTWLASLIAAYAGLRAMEICRLERGHVTEDMLTVHEGKGGHQRQVPTHPAIWQAVAGQPPGPVVPTSERLLTSRCWRAYHRAGVDTSIHRLRAWYATELWRAGVDLETIRQLLGHTSLATTQRYLGVDPQRLTAAVAALPVVLAQPAWPASPGRAQHLNGQQFQRGPLVEQQDHVGLVEVDHGPGAARVAG